VTGNAGHSLDLDDAFGGDFSPLTNCSPGNAERAGKGSDTAFA
jgi:hypothetical protein